MGVVLYHRISKLSFKCAVGRTSIAMNGHRVLGLPYVCEHAQISNLIGSALAVEEHSVLVDYSSFFLLHKVVLLLVEVLSFHSCVYINICMHLLLLPFFFRTLPWDVPPLPTFEAVLPQLPRVVSSFSLRKYCSFFACCSSFLPAHVPPSRWLVCVQDLEYSLRALGVLACLHYKVLFHASFKVVIFCIVGSI